jgi:hypothetical protein
MLPHAVLVSLLQKQLPGELIARMSVSPELPIYH